jgi:hypothetical protein
VSSAPDPRPTGVVNLTARRGYQADYRGLACAQIRADRERLGLGYEDYAEHLSGLLGRKIPAQLVKRWEHGNVPPGDVLLAGSGMTPPASGLLEEVPQSFVADALAGAWVTCYRFSEPAKYHADIAHLTVTSGRRIRIANYPPAPRTEGHASPFLNEIEALLVSRHLVGTWKNTSDARYFGSLHLSVLPGETVMEGYFTNFVSDIHVGTGPWKWVRLDHASLDGADLRTVTLREPAELYALLEGHSQYDAPLKLTALGEVA